MEFHRTHAAAAQPMEDPETGVWLSLVQGAQLFSARAEDGAAAARWAEEATAELVATAAVRTGEQVVDIAAGRGEPGLALAAAAGVTTLVDSDAEALSQARTKARRMGLSVRTLCAAAEQIPLPSGCADLVTCQWGLWHFARPARVLAEVDRLLAVATDGRPGGRFVALDWGPNEGTDLYQATWRLLGVPASAGATLAELIEGSLSVREARTATITVRWGGGASELVDSLVQHTPALTRRLAKLKPAAATALRAAGAEVLERSRTAGVLELTARVELVVAQRAESPRTEPRLEAEP